MKKKNPFYDNDEIDIIDLLKIIWDGKIAITIITLISFLVGFGYSNQLPNNNLNSLNITKVNNSEFLKFDSVKRLVNGIQSTQSSQSIQSAQIEIPSKQKLSNQIILDRFIDELNDYDEFLFILENTKKVREKLRGLSDEEKEIELFKYVNLLTISKIKNNGNNYTLNLKWDDFNEAKKIFLDTLSLTLNNFNETIFNELKQSLEFEKKIILSKDRERLDYLREQSSIAKEINIEENQIDNFSSSQTSVSFNINTADTAYYLRGYKAIDKEMELIQNRKYDNLKFIEKEINSLKQDNLKWVRYNIHSTKVKSLKKDKLILIISIFLGIIVGLIYVFVSNKFHIKK